MLEEFLEDLSEGFLDVLKIIKEGHKLLTDIELQAIKHQSQIAQYQQNAATDDIKVKDVTPGDTGSGHKASSPPKDDVIETELSSNGSYVPKSKRLGKKI